MENKKDFNINEINNILPERLKHFRTQKGLSLRDVADKIDKSPSQISFWEKGVNPPSCIDLFKLCVIYDIMLPDLFPEISERLKPVKEEVELFKKYRAADKDVQITIQKILEYTKKP